MPLILNPKTRRAWLAEEPADPPPPKAMLAPHPSDKITCWPVNPRVGNVKNSDMWLIEPIVMA